ncbi:hypothetical protein Q73_07575 [Bacillus coahuilensis m2-6]|uniref:hypothetical protein n=1 Tax=Bacillus coahuilensis TaxID=408580 RepID=UPI00075017DB|nr:hypothetical protein [Bacillus coahuilensis]KUP08075.1 hypothetical protein Q73_07575 [Bacillus coahuilensis m2-6]
MRLFYGIIITLLLGGCSSTASEPISTSAMEKFLDDSEYMIEILETAYWDGFRELSFDEEREFIAYIALYDSDSDFQKRADDTNISLIATNISLAQLYLGSEGTAVGENNPKSDFVKSKDDAEKYLKEAMTEYLIE